MRCYNNIYLEILTQVTVGENEGIESALRRFKRQVSKAGIFADLKRLRHHETPIEKYKRKFFYSGMILEIALIPINIH